MKFSPDGTYWFNTDTIGITAIDWNWLNATTAIGYRYDEVDPDGMWTCVFPAKTMAVVPGHRGEPRLRFMAEGKDEWLGDYSTGPKDSAGTTWNGESYSANGIGDQGERIFVGKPAFATIIISRNGVEQTISAPQYMNDKVTMRGGHLMWHSTTGARDLNGAAIGPPGAMQTFCIAPGGQRWCVGYVADHGLCVWKWGTSNGYVLDATGNDFYPDIVATTATLLKIGSSQTQGDTGLQLYTINLSSNQWTDPAGTVHPLTEISLGPAISNPDDGVTIITPGTGPNAPQTGTLMSTGTFDVIGEVEEFVPFPPELFPTFPVESGYGRIIHPTLGAFDYEVKPDEWVNIDADAIIPPVWASTRTLTSAANVLWNGNIRDVVIEERWKALGGLAMPITQFRMLLAIWTTPVDPDVGYVHWYPNYITQVAFKVLPVGLTAGGQGITFDDIVNYKENRGDATNKIHRGWMTNPVTFVLKLAGRL